MSVCLKCYQAIEGTVHICPINNMYMPPAIQNVSKPSELEATLARLMMMRETMMVQRAELQENIDAIDKVFDIVAAGRSGTPGMSKSSWIRFVCWFSRKCFDIHDYKLAWGGNGYPAHFYTYRCWNCGKEFEI